MNLSYIIPAVVVVIIFAIEFSIPEKKDTCEFSKVSEITKLKLPLFNRIALKWTKYKNAFPWLGDKGVELTKHYINW